MAESQDLFESTITDPNDGPGVPVPPFNKLQISSTKRKLAARAVEIDSEAPSKRKRQGSLRLVRVQGGNSEWSKASTKDRTDVFSSVDESFKNPDGNDPGRDIDSQDDIDFSQSQLQDSETQDPSSKVPKSFGDDDRRENESLVNFNNEEPANLTMASEVLIDDYYTMEQELILKIWALSPFKECLSQLGNSLTKEKYGKDTVLKVLSSNWSTIATKEIFEIFSWLQTQVGDFIVGCLLIDYINQNPTDRIIEAFNKNGRFSAHLLELVELAIALSLQKKVRLEYPKLDFIEVLPENIRSKLSLECCALLETASGATKSDKQAIVSKRELQLSFELSSRLSSWIDKHVEKHAFRKEGVIDKSKLLIKFVSDYMCSITEESPPTAFNILLKTTKDAKLCTTTFKIRTVDHGVVLLQLHEPVLHVYKLGNQIHEQSIHATPEDAKVFEDLLYLDVNGAYNIQRKVSLGVCLIAEQIGICEIWSLLFRDRFNRDLMMENNRRSILPILFRLQKLQEIDDIVEDMSAVFPGPLLDECLYGLEADHVIALIPKLDLNPLRLCKMLIRWAHATVDKPCPDPMEQFCVPEVKKHFLKIKRLLPLSSILPHCYNLLQNNYITNEELSKAKDEYYGGINAQAMHYS